MRRATGNSRGFGFVHFTAPEVAKSAADALNGKSIEGRPLVVRLRSERASSGAHRGGGEARPERNHLPAASSWAKLLVWCSAAMYARQGRTGFARKTRLLRVSFGMNPTSGIVVTGRAHTHKSANGMHVCGLAFLGHALCCM